MKKFGAFKTIDGDIATRGGKSLVKVMEADTREKLIEQLDNSEDIYPGPEYLILEFEVYRFVRSDM